MFFLKKGLWSFLIIFFSFTPFLVFSQTVTKKNSQSIVVTDSSPVDQTIYSPLSAHLKLDVSNIVLNNDNYIEVKLSPFFKIYNFYAALELPFQIDTSTGGFYNYNTYLHPSNYLQFINTFGYGKFTDPTWFQVGSLIDINLGEGSLVNHFRNDLFMPQIRNLGLYLSSHYKYAGIDAFSNNISNFSLSGLNIYGKPLAFLDSDNVFSDLKIGVSFVYDLDNQNQIYTAQDVINLNTFNPDSNPLYAYSVNISLPFYKNNTLTLGIALEYSGIIQSHEENQYSFYGKFFLDYKFYHLDFGMAYLKNGFYFDLFSSLYLQPDIRENRANEYQGTSNAFAYSVNNEFSFYEKNLSFSLDIYGQSEGSFSYNIAFNLKPILLRGFGMSIGYIKEDTQNAEETFYFTSATNKNLVYVEISYLINEKARMLFLYRKDFYTSYDDPKIRNNDEFDFQISLFL